MTGKVINLVGFQCCWFACVLGAAEGMPGLGVAVVTGWVLVHLRTSRARVRPELELVAAALALGAVVDSLLVLGGWLGFPEQARLGAPTTAWMLALWAAFATTLNHSMGWLRGRYALGALAGAMSGPLVYWAGMRLGAVELPRGVESALGVALLWAISVPLLLRVQAHGFGRRLREVG